MAPIISYKKLISDLDRDVQRVLPSDPLQFCFKWFQARLEIEREERFNSPVGLNALGFQQMGKGNFSKRSFDGFSLAEPKIESVTPSPGAFDSKRRRMAIHAAPMNSRELLSLSPCSSTSSTFENRSTPVNAQSILTLPLTLSPGSRRASDATFASKDGQRRRNSHLTTPPLSPPTTSESSSSSSSSPSSDIEIVDSTSVSLKRKSCIPTNYVLDRRTSVSSESLTPSTTSDLPLSIIPKSAEARARIEKCIPDNLLFRNLHQEQLTDIFNAIQEIKVEKGVEVILQGAVGENFYIVASGSLEAWVREPTRYSYINAGNSQSIPGKLARVASYGPQDYFGELALLHNSPRAATVVATSSSTLFSLDRVSFRRILMEHTSKKRKMYEIFLSDLPFLAGLRSKERSKIADTLDERVYKSGETIIEEGNEGKDFFIIGSGRAEVLNRRTGRVDEIIGSLSSGEYFGGLASVNLRIRAARESGPLRVGVIPEQALTRLLGPSASDLFRKR